MSEIERTANERGFNFDNLLSKGLKKNFIKIVISKAKIVLVGTDVYLVIWSGISV